ncbi:hypothetical protein D1872_235340 [compost metagenome]
MVFYDQLHIAKRLLKLTGTQHRGHLLRTAVHHPGRRLEQQRHLGLANLPALHQYADQMLHVSGQPVAVFVGKVRADHADVIQQHTARDKGQVRRVAFDLFPA